MLDKSYIQGFRNNNGLQHAEYRKSPRQNVLELYFDKLCEIKIQNWYSLFSGSTGIHQILATLGLKCGGNNFFKIQYVDGYIMMTII